MLEDKIIEQLSNEHSTPCFVFDEQALTERAQAIRGLLGDISLCYSVKANPFLIRALLPFVDYFEVCSPGELAICRNLPVPGNKIIYSGVHKETEDVTEAVRYGAAFLTAESVSQYGTIKDCAEKLNIKDDLLLRLTSKSQFGMSPEDIESVLSDPSEMVSFAGIHYFAGTGRKHSDKQREELSMLTGFINDMRSRYDIALPMLEYGPGLYYPYFEDDDHSDTLAPLKDITDALGTVRHNCTLSVEMGRFLASECGYYLTRICDIKRSANANWCIVDGGINHVNYLGQMMGMKVPVICHYRNGKVIDDSQGNVYTVCGSLCTTNDVLIRSMTLNDPRTDDILVFSNIGAYSVTESMGLFLSRTLPRIIAKRGDELVILRDFTESWKINSPDRV